MTTKRVPENSLIFKNSKLENKVMNTKTMNYCIVFDKQTIGIEIPVSYDSHTSKAERYICDNFLQFSELDEHGYRRLKKSVGYTSVSSAIKWGHTILPL